MQDDVGDEHDAREQEGEAEVHPEAQVVLVGRVVHVVALHQVVSAVGIAAAVIGVSGADRARRQGGVVQRRQHGNVAEVLLVEEGAGVTGLRHVRQVIQPVGHRRYGTRHGAAQVDVDGSQEDGHYGRVVRTLDEHQQSHRLLFHEEIDGPQCGGEQEPLEHICRHAQAEVDERRSSQYGGYRLRDRRNASGQHEQRPEVEPVARFLVAVELLRERRLK